MITKDQLLKILPKFPAKVALFIDPLNAAMTKYGITSKLEVASFLSQIGHESMQLYYTEEIASGAAYENRKDLGNTQPGDGKLYKGRGLIQITGRANYAACAMALDLDCLVNPQILTQTGNAALSAAWWWNANGCKKWALAGNNTAVSGIVNTGSPNRDPKKINGLDDRMALYKKALEVL